MSILLRLINGAALEESGQLLENVDLTHLAVESVKLVPKRYRQLKLFAIELFKKLEHIFSYDHCA